MTETQTDRDAMVRRLDRLATYWLILAGYVVALIIAIVYWQDQRIDARQRLAYYELSRQNHEQAETILELRHERDANDEAAKECEAKAALTPNQ